MRSYIVTAVLLLAGIAQADTLTVCPHGCDYASIQAALDAASSGDVVEVHSGEYGEEISLNKEVTLRGVDTGGGKPSIEVMHLCGHGESSATGFTFLVLDFGYPNFGMPEMIEKPKASKDLSKTSASIWENLNKPLTSPETAATEEAKIPEEIEKRPQVVAPEGSKIAQAISEPATGPSIVSPGGSKLSKNLSKSVTKPAVVAPEESKIAQAISKTATGPSIVSPGGSKLSKNLSKPVAKPAVVAPEESKLSQAIGKPATTASVVSSVEPRLSPVIGKPATSPAASAPEEGKLSKMISKPFTSPGAAVPEAVKIPEEAEKPHAVPKAIVPKAPEFPKEVSKPSAVPAVAAPSYQKQGKLRYYEDFSYTQPVVYPSGYKRDYIVTYGGRRLQIAVPSANYIAYFDPTKRTFFSDFVVEVEAAHEDGPEESDYGVILRRADESNYYRFRISSSGYYGFDKMQDGHLANLVPWTWSPDIHTGKGTNLIKVECKGKKFTFGVNGVALGSCGDDSFEGGTFGLEVGSHASGGAQVNFDNLKFYDLA